MHILTVEGNQVDLSRRLWKAKLKKTSKQKLKTLNSIEIDMIMKMKKEEPIPKKRGQTLHNIDNMLKLTEITPKLKAGSEMKKETQSPQLEKGHTWLTPMDNNNNHLLMKN